MADTDRLAIKTNQIAAKPYSSWSSKQTCNKKPKNPPNQVFSHALARPEQNRQGRERWVGKLDLIERERGEDQSDGTGKLKRGLIGSVKKSSQMNWGRGNREKGLNSWVSEKERSVWLVMGLHDIGVVGWWREANAEATTRQQINMAAMEYERAHSTFCVR